MFLNVEQASEVEHQYQTNNVNLKSGFSFRITLKNHIYHSKNTIKRQNMCITCLNSKFYTVFITEIQFNRDNAPYIDGLVQNWTF